MFRRFYFSNEFSKEYFKSSYYELLLSTLLPSIFFHLNASIILNFVFEYEFDLSLYAALTENLSESLQRDYQSAIKVAIAYNIILWAVASLAGFYLKKLVRLRKWDRKYKLLRFKNEWHYLVTGEILDFPNVPGEASIVDFVWVDLMVQANEGTVLYTGILNDYVLSKENGLDRIYLTEVVRRYLSDDFNEERKEYEIPGNFMVFPFDKVLNMNLTYYEIEEDDL